MHDYPRLRNEVDYDPRQRGVMETDLTERDKTEREEE